MARINSSSNLLDLIENSGKSNLELERDLNLPRSTVYDWKKGRSRSYQKYLSAIAAYFNVSVDYLLDRETAATMRADEGFLERPVNLACSLVFNNTCQNLKSCLSLYETYYKQNSCDTDGRKAEEIEEMICKHVLEITEAYKCLAEALISNKKSADAVASLHAALGSDDRVNRFIDAIYSEDDDNVDEPV